MVEFIADDCILRAKQGLKQPRVGIKAAGVQDGVLCAMEGTDATLQLLVKVLRGWGKGERALSGVNHETTAAGLYAFGTGCACCLMPP